MEKLDEAFKQMTGRNATAGEHREVEEMLRRDNTCSLPLQNSNRRD
jgi:hypothetical protein